MLSLIQLNSIQDRLLTFLLTVPTARTVVEQRRRCIFSMLSLGLRHCPSRFRTWCRNGQSFSGDRTYTHFCIEEQPTRAYERLSTPPFSGSILSFSRRGAALCDHVLRRDGCACETDNGRLSCTIPHRLAAGVGLAFHRIHHWLCRNRTAGVLACPPDLAA